MGRLFDEYYRKEKRADYYRLAKRVDPSALTETPLSTYKDVWEQTYGFLLQRRDDMFDLPRDAPARLQVDSAIGILEKAKPDPDIEPDALKAVVETMVSEFGSLFAGEEPGEMKEFADRTVDAMRDVSYVLSGEVEAGVGEPPGGPGMGGMGPGGEMDMEGEGEEGEEEENDLDKIAAELLPGEGEEGEEEAGPAGPPGPGRRPPV